MWGESEAEGWTRSGGREKGEVSVSEIPPARGLMLKGSIP